MQVGGQTIMGEEGVTNFLPTLARACFDMESKGEGERILATAVRRATAIQRKPVLLDTWRVEALAASRDGDDEKALRALDGALALSRSMNYPYVEAQILYELALVHGHMGDGEHAVGKLEQALSTFRRLGARPYIERTEKALSRLQTHDVRKS